MAAPRERLLDEWLGLPGLDRQHLDLLDRLGVSTEAQERAGGVRLAHVATCGRCFLPHPDGPPMLALAVWSGPAPSPWRTVEDPWANDVITFRPEEPWRWWLRRGNGGVLGEDNLLLALETGRPITLHMHALGWLQADCRGAVLLDDLEMRYAAGWRAAA